MAIQVGKYNKLTVVKHLQQGMYLSDGEGAEILLPTRYIPEGLEVEMQITVFIHHDSEGRLIANTLEPKAIVGHFAVMKSLMKTTHGTFVDWGIAKDLLVPENQQLEPMEVGKEYLIYVFLDQKSGRIAGTQKVHLFLSNENIVLKEKDAIRMTIYRDSPLGYEVIIDEKHIGLLHHSDVYQKYTIGESLDGYVKKVREDQKIDIGVGKIGYENNADFVLKLRQLLEENNGFLPYHDKSDAQQIHDDLHMSKRNFKMAVGFLFKNKEIQITDQGIQKV